MDAVPVPVRVMKPLRRLEDVLIVTADIRQSVLFDESVGDVDAESVDAAIEPERQHALKLLPHVRVVPVEVRLLFGEEVQVPLPVRYPGPGGSAEGAAPVVGRQFTV